LFSSNRHPRQEKEEIVLPSFSLHAVATKLARAAGATAIGVTVGFAGSASPVVNSPTTLTTAEQVAAQFVGGFESFSYRNPGAKAAVADLATGSLATVLSSPSQGSVGPALVAEKFTATAHVIGFEVESDTSTSVTLLARTDIRISTTTGSSSSIRLIPVSVVLAGADWKVNAVDGLRVTPSTPATPGTPDGSSTTAPGSGSSTGTTTSPGAAPGSSVAAPAPVTAVGDAPAAYVGWMKAAVAAVCPGLPWTVLAGIAKVESNFGRSKLPGVSSGSNPMGAEGPMQFEPATYAAYGMVAPGGADPASPYDPADAIYSAARLLCADGGGNPAHLYAAIFDYNHSDAYVSLVLAYANEYSQMASGGTSDERGLGSVIVADAETYLGTPYVWGGESPRSGFDCSGLVQWVYAEAGISLPRVAQDQYDAGPHLPAGATLYPGDLVFFGPGPSGVEHVGIYVGNGEMIDAPYTGAVVRFDRVSSVSLGFVGATRPEIPDLTGGAGVPVIGTDDAQPAGGGSGSGAGRQANGQGHSSAGGAPRHGIDQSTGLSHPYRHDPTTVSSTTVPGPGTIRPGRHHPTTTTEPPPTTTSSTAPGTPTHPGRHHPTTTTTIPATTTTTETPTTTTPVPPTTAPSSDADTSTTTAPVDGPSGSATTTTPRNGHHHPKGG
jgi:cell wall-associated NlpC family hydrolase